MQIAFVCENCGGKEFKVTAEPKTLEDVYGAICAKCGTALSESDIKRQALKIAEKAARDAFRKS